MTPALDELEGFPPPWGDAIMTGGEDAPTFADFTKWASDLEALNTNTQERNAMNDNKTKKRRVIRLPAGINQAAYGAMRAHYDQGDLGEWPLREICRQLELPTSLDSLPDAVRQEVEAMLEDNADKDGYILSAPRYTVLYADGDKVIVETNAGYVCASSHNCWDWGDVAAGDIIGYLVDGTLFEPWPVVD